MPVDELLAVLAELRKADIRLATTLSGSPERAAAMREIHRLERIAFADALRPERGTGARPVGPANAAS